MKTRKRSQVSLAVNPLEERNAPSGFAAPMLELSSYSSATMVELNPQPLPPGEARGEDAIIIIGG